MGWVESSTREKTKTTKESFLYKADAEFIAFEPDTTREILILTGDKDPTGTWFSPAEVWVHTFKSENGFQTVICNKWEEACPLCYTNELFKLHNPLYREENKKMPYPVSPKALVQVYDYKLKKVLWFLAGKKIIEGMDFILSRQGNMYCGAIAITRIGDKLLTNYRVDVVVPKILAPEEIQLIKESTISFDNYRSHLKLTHKEFAEKTRIDPVAYFHEALKNNSIDISKWGALPTKAFVEPEQVQPITKEIKFSSDMVGAAELICTTGAYVNKKFYEVYQAAGKAYMQFLSQQGKDEAQKKAASYILSNWDLALEYAKSKDVPF